MGALSISCSALWMASASIRIICQLISLNVRIWTKRAKDEQWNYVVLDSNVLSDGHHNGNSHLSSLRILDPGESQVADAPAGVDAVNLQLRELKGCIEGFGADPNDDGVDWQRHALHHLLRKTVLAEERRENGISKVRKKKISSTRPKVKLTELVLVRRGSTHLCPDAVAMGEGPLGGRGSSQVLISISTLSRVCVQVRTQGFSSFHHVSLITDAADLCLCIQFVALQSSPVKI